MELIEDLGAKVYKCKINEYVNIFFAIEVKVIL